MTKKVFAEVVVRAYLFSLLFLGALISGVSLEAEPEEGVYQTLYGYQPLSFLNQSDQMQFYSQANQDVFVYYLLYGLLNKQDKGYYLEIGGADPICINNSYFFEKNLQWDGVSIDITADFAERWSSVRRNPLLVEDAVQSDYSVILQNFPQVIDYLSLDVDGYYDVVLEKVIESGHVFKIITIEHDFYRYGDYYRSKERQILRKLGYHLLCSDVSNYGSMFEDWWIYPDFFPSNIFSNLASVDVHSKEYKRIIQIIKSIVHRHQGL